MSNYSSVVSLKFAEEEPQILRLRKPQKTRLTTLRMALQLLNQLQTQDTSQARVSDVTTGYRSKFISLTDELVVMRAHQRRILAVVIGGLCLVVVLAMFAIGGQSMLFAAMVISLIGAGWALRRLLGLRRELVALARRSGFYERGMERVEEGWRGKGNAGLEFAREKHLYQTDLDVLGEGSLFELLCTTRSKVGAERLASFLLDPATLDEARARQEAVKELRDQTALREEIALLGKYEFQSCDGRHLREWLGMPLVKAPRIVPVFLLLSAGACLVLGVCGYATILSWTQIAPLLIPLLAAQAGIGLVLMRGVWLHIKALLGLGGDVMVLRQGMGLIEGQRFQSATLKKLAERLSRRDAARRIRRLERLLVAVERREDLILYAFGFWLAMGTQLVLAVERWRAAHQRELEDWLDAWAEFEALNALAGYAFEHPDCVFPELLDGGARFEAEGLCHPLLARDRGVGNDLTLNDSTAFYLISGSNMAGKSTFLRGMGLNAMLAAAGGPVRAVKARMSVFNVCAAIGVADSLAEGKSKFLAEVERLRASIGATAGERPVLFLIDEILNGTNSTDRRIAAESVIGALVAGGAVGALSTHDLALTEIAERAELRGCNVHMQSENPEEPLAFDYRVKPGILKQTNALAIVRMMGIATCGGADAFGRPAPGRTARDGVHEGRDVAIES